MKLIMSLLLTLCVFQTVQANTIVLTKGNTVVMNQPFRSSSVAVVQHKLAELAGKTKGDLYLVLNSPGGSISAGLSLISFIKGLPNKVHTITIFAASMAYLLAQNLDKRYIVSSGRMMSHRASISGLSGQVPGEAISRLTHIEQIVRELFNSASDRVGVSYSNYMSSVYDELWLTAKKAVKLNHADEIGSFKCGKSLSGSKTIRVRTFFGATNVVFSNCPLIQGPLRIGTGDRRIRRLILKKLDYSSRKYFELTL